MKTRLPGKTSEVRQMSALLSYAKKSCILFLLSILFLSAKTFAQSPCGSVNCTSNDVQVLSAYISAPDNMPIDCNASNPFDNAELHLIVSSNTQRIGVSILANLNTSADNSYPIGHCFTGITLNNGSNNNLSFSLGHILADVQCGPSFTLTSVFVSWGTGNTDFCEASADPHCPATPAKCRFKPGEIIPVEVKLEVDFNWMAGVCSNGGNSLSLDFTPSVITQQNLTFPLTFTWDFGDGSPTQQTTAASTSDADLAAAHITHAYASPGTYSITLVGSDASPFFSKTSVHTIMVIACCDVAAPILSVEDGCGSSTISAKDKDGNLISGDNLSWSNGEAGNPITVTTTDAVTATASSGDCSSSASNSVTPAPKTVPPAPILSVENNCGSSTVTAKDKDGNDIPADQLTWSNGATGNPINVTTTDEVTATVTIGDCTSDASTSVTPVPKTVPAAPTVHGDVECATTPLQTLTATADETVVWYDAASDGNVVSDPSLNQVGTVTYYAEAVSDGCRSTTRSAATLTINALPTVTTGSYGPFCSDASTISLGGAPAGGTWSGDGVSLVSGVYKFTPSSVTVGPHTLMYSYSNGTCSNSATTSVTVNALPICNISGASIIGVGQTNILSVVNNANYSYSWSISSNSAGAYFVGASNGYSVKIATTTAGTNTGYKVTVTITNNSTHCSKTCDYPVTVNTGNGYYTYTQGYYSSTGTSCTPLGGAKGAVALIQYALDNTDGVIGSPVPHTEQMVLGSMNHSFTLKYADASALVKIMPGGGTAAILSGNFTVANVPLKSGKISNVLLSQTITLGLNINIQGDGLKSFILKTGYLTTQKGDLSTCPTTKVVPCSKDASTISSLQIATSTGMKTWIAGKTVNDLFNLASSALGGSSLPSGVSLTDITNAIDAINKSFDAGRFFLGYYASAQTCSTISTAVANSASMNKPLGNSQLSVKAYPNPYNNTLNFHFASPQSGKATLIAYDLTGKKLAVIFEGNITSGSEYDVKYNVSPGNKVPMFYKLTVGNYTYHGMLIPQK